MGYTDVVDLSRDSMGVWHARAKKGTEAVDVIVDKAAASSLAVKDARTEPVSSRIRALGHFKHLSLRAERLGEG